MYRFFVYVRCYSFNPLGGFNKFRFTIFIQKSFESESHKNLNEWKSAPSTSVTVTAPCQRHQRHKTQQPQITTTTTLPTEFAGISKFDMWIIQKRITFVNFHDSSSIDGAISHFVVFVQLFTLGFLSALQLYFLFPRDTIGQHKRKHLYITYFSLLFFYIEISYSIATNCKITKFNIKHVTYTIII